MEKSFNPLLSYFEKFSALFSPISLPSALEWLIERAVPEIRIKRKAALLAIYKRKPDLIWMFSIPKKSRS